MLPLLQIIRTNLRTSSNKIIVRKLLLTCDHPRALSTIEVPHYLFSNNSQALQVGMKDMMVYEDFITSEEEESLLRELEPYLKRMRYESSHWDDAIHGYRETEKVNWNSSNMRIIDRVRKLAFDDDARQLRHVHVLDITAEGYIKPHIDSIKFCGDTITGISLLSTSIMRLVHSDNKEQYFDVLLKQRSLYVMKGEARYKYTHEILPETLSIFKKGNGHEGETHVPRQRRISVICRNAPVNVDD